MTTPRTEHIRAIEAALEDTRRGLPEDVFQFVSRITPLVTVDLLVKDDRSRTLLTWRDDQFFGPGWHVPGGIVRHKERLADRVHACARTELGVDVRCDPAPIFVLEHISGDATRGHHISLLFPCRLMGALDETRHAVTDPPQPGQWRWHERCPADLIEEQADYAQFLG